MVYTKVKIHWEIPSKYVNFTVCKLYLNNTFVHVLRLPHTSYNPLQSLRDLCLCPILVVLMDYHGGELSVSLEK